MLVALYGSRLIVEHDPTEWAPLRRYTMAAGRCPSPSHAVELPGGVEFAVTLHGPGRDYVYVMGYDGVVRRHYGGRTGSGDRRLRHAVGLAVDETTGSVFVADAANQRVVVLDRKMNRELVHRLGDGTPGGGSVVKCPLAVCYDGARNRLLIGGAKVVPPLFFDGETDGLIAAIQHRT